MARIATTETALSRIPLEITLSDSTHGEITAFELITCRIRDSDGAEGVGYTYTVGRNGGAVADILKREIPPLIEGREADDTESYLASRLVGSALWRAGRADRARALGARYRAVGSQGAARQSAALLVCSGPSIAGYPVTPAASTLISPSRRC